MKKLDDVQDEEDLAQGVVHRLKQAFALSKMHEALFLFSRRSATMVMKCETSHKYQVSETGPNYLCLWIWVQI